MDTASIVARAFRDYGLSERSDADFESSRRIYRRADVLQACSIEEESARDQAMIALKAKARLKA